MNNRWNRWIYKAWAPVYDMFFNSRPFRAARKAVFKMANIHAGNRVLLVGVGTGADLSYLSGMKVSITAIDLSGDMLAQARRKDISGAIHFMEMDAQQLSFPANSFDVVIANLILSVVPDANLCFSEMVRVTRNQGHIVILDKFAPRSGKLPKPLVLLRPLIKLMGTDIGRSFAPMIAPFKEEVGIQVDEGVMLGGLYRGIRLQKVRKTHERE
jgi:phosphatidylethanolamine/phosphatidyl-N-methylethanolamine N-methyltransferase